MSLRHAILGVLTDGALHGYAVTERLEHSIAGGRYNGAQVYQGLHWLTERGHVAADPLEAGRSRDRRPFHVTPKGVREFDRWLRSPFVPPRPSRDDAIVKLAFLARADPSLLVEFLVRLKKQHLRSLSASRLPRAKSGPPPDLAFELTTTALRGREEGELGWIDKCLDRLQPMIDGHALPSPAEDAAGAPVRRDRLA